MLTIPIPLPSNEEMMKEYYNDLKLCGADKVLITACEIFCDDEKREDIFTRIRKCTEYYTEKGLEPGVWTTTLGWGDERDDDFKRKFGDCTRITSFAGNTSGAVCVLDEKFAKHIERNIEDFVKAGVKLILLDDEFVLSVRPGFTCSCDLHIKLFNERTNREWTREEIRDLFTGKPTPERKIWMDLTGETMIDYCRRLRAVVDKFDPTVRIGLCASYTHYDLDGFDINELLKILAGENNRPYFRLSGATYWQAHAPRMTNMTMSGVVEFVRMQLGWLKDAEIDILDENDPHPRKTDVVPAQDVELYDKAMLTQDRVERLKYILHLGSDRNAGDTAYREAHIKNLENDEKVRSFFENKKAVGYRVFSVQHKIRDAEMADEYPPRSSMLLSLYTQNFGASLAARCGIPTRYGGDGPVIVFGEDARYLPENLANGNIISDNIGAKILKEKGIDCTELDIDLLKTDFSDVPRYDKIFRENYPDLPVYANGIYPLASKNEDGSEMAVMLINEDKKDFENHEIILDKNYTLADTINCEAKVDGNVLTLKKIGARDWVCVLLNTK